LKITFLMELGSDFLFDRGTVQLDLGDVTELLGDGEEASAARERALEMFEQKGDLVSAAEPFQSWIVMGADHRCSAPEERLCGSCVRPRAPLRAVVPLWHLLDPCDHCRGSAGTGQRGRASDARESCARRSA
jgi:hypothetical protein